MMSRSSLFFAFAVAILAAVEGYVVPQSANRQSTALSAQSSRRAFAVASMGAAFATLASGAPAFALDDLAMPSGGDADAQSKAEMEARLARKAELKAKAAQPKTYAESVQKELEKKKADSAVSQQDRRNAMCEELGRGC